MMNSDLPSRERLCVGRSWPSLTPPCSLPTSSPMAGGMLGYPGIRLGCGTLLHLTLLKKGAPEAGGWQGWQDGPLWRCQQVGAALAVL